jgi:hypothetical protein
VRNGSARPLLSCWGDEEERIMQSTRRSAGNAGLGRGEWSGALPAAAAPRPTAATPSTRAAVARTLFLVEAEMPESTGVSRTRFLADEPAPAPVATRSPWALLGPIATVSLGILLGFAAVLAIAG